MPTQTRKRPTPKIKVKDEGRTLVPPPVVDRTGDNGPSGNGFDDADRPGVTTTKPGDAWPASVCRRLRHFRNLDKEYKRLRVDQFTVRDNANAELSNLGANDPNREEWESALGRAVREIDRLQKSLKWANQQLIETIDDADKPELFENIDEKPMPPPSLFEIKDKGAGKAAVGGDDEEGDENEGD